MSGAKWIGLAATDGRRPVFWGVGNTIHAARADAAVCLSDLSNLEPDDLTTIEISAERAAEIMNGDIALNDEETAMYLQMRIL